MKLKVGATVAVISFIVFIIVNLLENLLYYNIGYNAKEDEEGKEKEKMLTLPNTQDWVKIIIIMLLFAAIQGLLTMLIFDYDMGYFSGQK